ncbi:MAG: hypothetical protein HOP29_05860 [Phycisphaerales bacterium]|nr:hypothetical protein [Phycisphaerales bacterium]
MSGIQRTGLEPDVLSLIVCDQIITDRITGKQSLIGMFSRIHATRFPATQPQLCVHVSLTDGRGSTPLTLKIVDSEESRDPIVQGQGVVEFGNPRAVANLALQFFGLVFPSPGEYRVQLFASGTLLREARLELLPAKRMKAPPAPPSEPPAESPPG